MRYLIFIFNIISICGCNSLSNNKATKDHSISETKAIKCDQNYDSLLLRYANEFTPTSVDLNSSLSSDLQSFLLAVDSNCLREQTEYKYFIALILGKLA